MRIDGKGGSRIVPCSKCGAKKGEFCRDGARLRLQSHRGRVWKAHELVAKKDREKRLSHRETEGAQAFLRNLPPLGASSPEFGEGWCIAQEVAREATERMLKKRGTK